MKSLASKLFFAHKKTIYVVVFLFLYSVTITFAVPPGTTYNPGETLDPNCAPGDTNCYVDVGGAITASNGLTKTGTDIALGGALTDVVTVNANIGGFNILANLTNNRSLFVGWDQISLGCNTCTNGGFIRIGDDYLTVFGSGTFPGLTYNVDHSSNFVARSLIDKGYADSTYWKVTGTTTLSGANTISGNFNKFFTGTGGFVIGHSALTTANTRLQVRGTGTTTNILALFEDNSGTTRFSVLDNGNFSVAQGIITSGSPTFGLFTGGAHTTLAADTEAVDVNFNLARIVQFSQGGGTFTSQRAFRIQAPTYAFTSADTITHASTLAISGAPIAGTNATITNRYAVNIETGTLRIGGNSLIMDYQASLTVPTRISELLQARVLGTSSDYYGLIGTIGGAYYLRHYELAYGWNIDAAAQVEITDPYGAALDYANTSYHVQITATIAGGEEVYEAIIHGSTPTVTVIRPATNISLLVTGGHVEVVNTGGNANWQGFVRPFPRYSSTIAPYQTKTTWDQGATIQTLSARLSVLNDTASNYTANFFNDGNNANRYGIQVQAGADDGSSTTYYLNALDGNGDQVGYIANTSGTFALTDVSDISTKSNIENTSVNGLSTINSLRVVDFNRISNPSGPRITGFIAQEVQGIYGKAVSENEDGLLGISQTAFIPVLVKAVQDIDVKYTNLLDLTQTENTFRVSLVNWLADVNNGIGDFFVNKIVTKELCVEDVCVTRDQFLQIVAPTLPATPPTSTIEVIVDESEDLADIPEASVLEESVEEETIE